MTQAAILIQSKFRSYAEQKRFQRRRRAAVLIQQRFRSLRQHRCGPGPRGARGTEPRGSHLPLRSPRSTFLTLKQDQAARKIMRFLRRCRHRYGEGTPVMWGGTRRCHMGWVGTGDTMGAESQKSLIPPIGVLSPRMEELKQNKEVDSLQTRGLAS